VVIAAKRSSDWTVTPAFQSELAALRADAAERGAEAGLNDLPDAPFDSSIRARAVLLSRRLHGAPAPCPERLGDLLTELEAERRALSGTVEGLRSRSPFMARPVAAPHVPWRPAANAFLMAAMALLSLEATGVVIGWRAAAAVALASTLLAVNVPLFPGVWFDLTWLARHTYRCGLLQRRLRKVDRRIDRVREDQISAADRAAAEARWISEVCALLRADYDVQLARGRAARRLGRAVAA
jgi:hypothetical protein